MSAWHEGLDNWLSALHQRLAADHALVRVVVAATKGSAPREPGACMIVSGETQYGTIGGGHLEYTAIDIARSMLATDAAASRVDRFVLGATLGQCCGGVVELVFDRYEEADRALLSSAIEASRPGRPVVLASRLGSGCAARRSLHSAEKRPVTTAPSVSTSVAMAVEALLTAPADGVRARLLAEGDGNASVLVERIDHPRMPLWVFGAGHVGAALVRVLAELPFRITWVDDRENAFPPALPVGVTPLGGGDPVADVRDAPAASHFLVLTHSHDLDLDLCRAILARGDAASVGLIGSASKSARFRRRLAQAGIPQQRIDELRCPIGVPGIDDKRPGVIAVAVAAELLQIANAGRARAGVAAASGASAAAATGVSAPQADRISAPVIAGVPAAAATASPVAAASGESAAAASSAQAAAQSDPSAARLRRSR